MTEQTEPKSPVRILRVILILGFFVLVVILLVFGIPKAQQYVTESLNPAVPLITDIPAPELTLTDLQGRNVSIRDYRGSTLLVNNWATWCPPCRAEMPALEEYYRAHVHQAFVIVAINSGESAQTVDAYVKQADLHFQVWLDPLSQSLEIFQNHDLPSSYVIDRQGVIRLAWTGAVSQLVLEEYLTPILEE